MKRPVQAAEAIFIGEDRTYNYQVWDDDDSAVAQAVDITSWTLSYTVKRRKGDGDADALLTKTTGGNGIAITGTYNTNITTNTQRAAVTIADTDLDALAPGLAYYELKRTGTDVETVIAFGTMTLSRGLHRT